jgi:hypothetical protein
VADRSGLPVAPGAGALRRLGVNEVRLDSGFWADRLWANRGPATMRVWLPAAP